MRLFVDLDAQRFILGPNTTQELSSISVIRSPAAQIEIQFLRGVTPQELSSSASGIFEVKTALEFDSSPLTAALAWTKTGTGETTIYTFNLPLVNDPLDLLLGVDALHAFTVVAATDLFTSVGHLLTAGTIIQNSSTVALPTPLLPNTNYYVLASGLTADDYKLSLTNGGAAINITDTGTGIHSFRRITNDATTVTLMAALQWVEDGLTIETQKIDFVLKNDVVREGDIPPAFPPLVYGVWFPEIIGGTLADFKAVATVGMSLGYITQQLIDVSGTLIFLPYHLESGPATESEPQHVEPDDYDLSTNNVHWNGAAGPSGPQGVNAGIPYKWNTGTSGDPGSGKLLASSATFASITSINLSDLDQAGNNLETLFATYDDSTSTIRGRLLVQDPADLTNFKIFDVTGSRTNLSGYSTFAVTPILAGGTLTSNLSVQLFFVPTGDKGESGDTGFKYVYSNSTSGDPGTGKFLFNDANFPFATLFHISETDGNALSLATFLAAIADSTSPNKVLVTCFKRAGTALFSFYITAALIDVGAYDTFAISPILKTGSISNGDTFFINFSVIADKGEDGTGEDNPDYILIQERVAANTAGGTFTGGSSIYYTRQLNEVRADSGSHVFDLTTGSIELEEGTYRYRASAPAYKVGLHKVAFTNTDSGTYTEGGTTEKSAAADDTQTRSEVIGTVIIAGPSEHCELQHICQTTRATDGRGVPGNFPLLLTDDSEEVYAQIELWKIA